MSKYKASQMPAWSLEEKLSKPTRNGTTGIPEYSDRLRVEAECRNVCIYCMSPSFGPDGSVQATSYDHLIPESLWENGDESYTMGNLVFACTMCNSLRGDFFPFKISEFGTLKRKHVISVVRQKLDTLRAEKWIELRDRYMKEQFERRPTTGRSKDYGP